MASLIRNHTLCNSVAIYLCLYTSLIPLRPIVTIETIVTAKMVAINNRPMRRNGLNWSYIVAASRDHSTTFNYP